MSNHSNSEKAGVEERDKTPPNAIGPLDENDKSLSYLAGKGHVATDAHGRSLFVIDPKVESRLRWKLDFYTVPVVSLLYLFCFIDRANIAQSTPSHDEPAHLTFFSSRAGNAKIAGFEEDLGLEGYDFNVVLTCFYISYIVFEIPSNICCKWVGPGWFIPFICFGFGAISICNGYVQNKAQACGVRFLLGIFESGTLPGIAYYLSRWYKRAELAFRLSLYMIMAPLAGAFGSLLASAILELDHFGNVESWRMIFVIEGIVTMGLSFIAFFIMTDSPESAKWLTDEEKDLVRARIKAERIATTIVLDKIDKPKLWRGILCPITLTVGAIFFLNNITVQGLAFFLPTIVATIFPDDTVQRKQLLAAPPNLVGGFFLLAVCWFAWKLDRRVIFTICSAPAVITGYAVFIGSDNPTGQYVAAFLIASSTYFLGPLSNAIISANVVSDTARSSGIGMNVMMGNFGGLISTWCWLKTDAPHYYIGHGINLAVSCLLFILSAGLLFWMKKDNKKRDLRSPEEELAGMSQKEIEDLDWKHPGFRWNP
ncbi:putative mfs transporter protein [Zalerion maritima]|uniref:Mfs transporter protein n=1 Tax=Zalerion maritima TaxID=339359 RepID=A0AAD5RVY7_9PEZI|nr:putative mfs transporter protein [Zalerion maritima]